jgi:hypothetical protein
MNLEEIGLESVAFVKTAQDRIHWWAFVNTVLNIRFPLQTGILLLVEQLSASQDEFNSMQLVTGGHLLALSCVEVGRMAPSSQTGRSEGSVVLKFRRVATFALTLTKRSLYFFCFLLPFHDMISHDSLCFPDNCFYIPVRHVCTLVLLRWKMVKTNYCYRFSSAALWTAAI